MITEWHTLGTDRWADGRGVKHKQPPKGGSLTNNRQLTSRVASLQTLSSRSAELVISRVSSRVTTKSQTYHITIIIIITITITNTIIIIIMYKARLSGLPVYRQHKIHDYHPSRTLRSTSALLLQQQPTTISFAARAFCAAAPTVWNSLGVHTHSADTFLTFKNRLKLNCLNLSTHNCFWHHRSAPDSLAD